MAEDQKKIQEKKIKEKKAISETDGQVTTRVGAGWAAAAKEWLVEKAVTGTLPDIAATGANQITSTINQLDAALTQLANLDLDGSCKKKAFEFTPGSEGDGTITGEDFAAAAQGCNPFKNLPAFQKVANGEDVEAEDVVSTIIGIVVKLTGPSSFPDCVFQQYKNFLSAFPVEYYLLLALKEAAELIKDPIETLNSVTACKTNNVAERIENLESEIPKPAIPTIPELPYINIPDLLDILINIILETICFALCTTLTPLIETIGENLFENISDVKESVGEDKNQPLVKTSIEPFLTPDVLVEIKSFVDKNIKNSQNIRAREIINFIVKVQNNPKISQDEFILLLLGKTNCNVYNTIVEDLPLTITQFELDTENKFLSFFAFVGSTINTLLFIQDSKAKVCDPNPCDLKEDEIIDKVSNLCNLLSPNTNLESLISTGEILDKTGALDFISGNLKTICDSIASSSRAYNPVYDAGDPLTLNQSYIEKFSGVLINFNEIMLATYNASPDILKSTTSTVFNTSPKRDVIRESIVSLRKIYYQQVFAFASVVLPGDNPKNNKIAASKDFKIDLSTVIGVAPTSTFDFEVFAGFSEQDLKDKMSFAAKKFNSSPQQTTKDMLRITELKKKYGII